jgi:hypothetical protein
MFQIPSSRILNRWLTLGFADNILTLCIVYFLFISITSYPGTSISTETHGPFEDMVNFNGLNSLVINMLSYLKEVLTFNNQYFISYLFFLQWKDSGKIRRRILARGWNPLLLLTPSAVAFNSVDKRDSKLNVIFFSFHIFAMILEYPHSWSRRAMNWPGSSALVPMSASMCWVLR